MSIPDSRICQLISCERPVSYSDALRWQYEILRRRVAGEIGDTILVLEHPATITLGRGAIAGDLLTSEEELARQGVSVVAVDRGGEITYHAPGQTVAYPILDLRKHGQDLHKYLRDLEEVVILTLSHYGINGYRIAGLTGVWVDEAKIAAIGIKVSRWVSMHGLAFNRDLDLTPMRRDFIPCGIRDRGVTSLREILGAKAPSRIDLEACLMAAFCDIFNLQVAPASAKLLQSLGIMGE